MWMGCIVMGLSYFIGFDYNREATPFVTGQIVLGIIGLLREEYLRNDNNA